jgi:putative endonuclease
MFTVYVLYSQIHDKHYTGFSSDFEARLASHNLFGKKDWSVRYRPWKVIHVETFENKTDAMKREKWLKSGVGRAFIKKIPH